MRPISLIRYNALAAYCRSPGTFFASEELAWFEQGCDRVLGTIIRDKTDNDFAGIILGRDQQNCFRCISLTEFESSQRRAEVLLRHQMDRLAMAPDEQFYQGDECGKPTDFFALKVSRDKLNLGFINLVEEEGFSPAKEIILPMMHWYEDPDGNFIEQFQTTGFDARIWELYLFATFVELGYCIDRSHSAPDFSCQGIFGELMVEAVTVNPTRDKKGNIIPPPDCKTSDEVKEFLRGYMPIKFGSALTSKLNKKYWEKPHVAGKPLLLAIHDFSRPMSMIYTRSALHPYLYGYDADWEHDVQGQLHITPRKIKNHRWGDKEIPSGFFDLPGAENVSAVIFSNSGTLSKFNRMGLIAGFGSPRVRLIREGTVLNHDRNATEPTTFQKNVNSQNYKENWVEGLEVFHNPRAKYPIDPMLLPGAGHHYLLQNGQMESFTPEWHPLGSITKILIESNS